jgi:gas vesicle protein
MGLRYYNANISRFITPDQFPGLITEPIIHNLYIYCNADPINNIDPTGQLAIGGWIKKAGKAIKKAVKKAVKKVKQVVKKAVTTVKKVVKQTAKKAAATVKKATTVVKKAVTAVKKTAKQVKKTVTTAVKSAVKTVSKAAAKVTQQAKEAVADIETAIVPSGPKIAQGLEGLIQNISPLGNWVEGGTGRTLITGQQLTEEQRQERINKGFECFESGLLSLGTGGLKGVKGPNFVVTPRGGSLPIPKGWKVGDDINTLTKAGKYPSWSTAKSRYWKNEAAVSPSKYSQENLDRMVKGKAPLDEDFGVSKELHHINGRGGPDAHNINNLQEVWPWEHAEIDPYRHYNASQP